jgi:hypothetical protein
MKAVIDLVIALAVNASFIFGAGYSIKKVHDVVKKAAIEQISKGLFSSEELANKLTGRRPHY